MKRETGRRAADLVIVDAQYETLAPVEVARLKKVSVQAVTQACREGRLPARKAGGTWHVRRADALAWEPRRKG